MAYSDKVVDHFQNPRNVGSLDTSAKDVGTGIVGAPECGDVMKLQIQVDERERIVDAKFKTFGCGSAIASSSLATEWVKGKTLDEALATVAVDLNGRGYSVLDVAWTGDRIGELPADLVNHLLWSIASEGKLTLNARVHAGVNDHHKAEVVAKAFGRALAAASRLEPRRQGNVPSTKGKLKT